MPLLIDTNIAICLRDGDPAVEARLAALGAMPMISVVTRVELEGGVYRDPQEAALLHERLDLLLGQFQELPFGAAEARAYGDILAACGFSRRSMVDRMIAAQAIAAGAALATLNPRDFRAIPGLVLDDWSV